MNFEISTQLIGLVAALAVIGKLLKETPKLPNWLIPWFLLTLSVIGSCLVLGTFNINSVIEGVVAYSLANAGHQLTKQSLERG